MIQAPSRKVTSDQREPDARLAQRVKRHLATAYARPPAEHTRVAVEWLLPRLAADRPLLLDSGCGTGESSRLLAEHWPDHQVVGIDRSASRLARGGWKAPGLESGSVLLLRADLVDAWRLLVAAGVRPDRHYLLYPNPYPKPGQLGRRWHGHPVFPSLVDLCGRLEVRTNWVIYAREFALALELAGVSGVLCSTITPDPALSPFERKYLHSGHQLFQVVANLGCPGNR